MTRAMCANRWPRARWSADWSTAHRRRTPIGWARVAATNVFLVANPDHMGEDPGPFERILRTARHLVWGPGSAIEAIGAEMLGDEYKPAQRLDVGSVGGRPPVVAERAGFMRHAGGRGPGRAPGLGCAGSAVPQRGPIAVFAVRRQGRSDRRSRALWQALTLTQRS